MMEWNRNYNVNYDSRTRSVAIPRVYSENLFRNFSEGINILLYLNRENFKNKGLNQSIAYGLSTIKDFNVAVATEPVIEYAENAQIIVPRLNGFEEKLRETYGDSKLIVGRDITGKIESDEDFYKRFVPRMRKDLDAIIKLRGVV